MLKDNWEDKHGTHMMLQPLQGFPDNQPIRHPFHNQFHQQNHQPTFIPNPYTNETEKTGIPSYNNNNSLLVKNTQADLTHKPIDNACTQTEAHKSSSPRESCTKTDAEKPVVDSNIQELIKFLSANYGPMKTPLEMGTPEYMRLVEILQQSGSYPEVKGLNSNTPSVITKQSEVISRNDQEKVVKKNDSVVEKKTPSEKLWEGSLQLSSSVTLSAITFFKSGEKLVGNNWPESIEVKGKVRLDAFEKYVKDLPRSRNRGLMVISVCWKEGSSDTGLSGMKEVAKGYKKSSRVGFAQLLSGIDLYICPRSDPIITILAKYGFFKGMSAVLDEKQDSMIGCVVWRKNRPLNPVNTKNSPDPIQLPNSPPSLSLTQHEHKQPTPLPLTSQSSNNIDHNVVNPSSNSDTCNLVQKRGFRDDDKDEDDLPEFDFGIKSVKSDISGNTRLGVVNCQNMENSQLTTLKKIKLFNDDDDDMPEWCPPPPKPTANFHNLPPLPPPPPPPLPPLPNIPPPPRVDTRATFSYQPFRPPPPAFMAAPPPPFMVAPPPLPPPQPGRFNSNQGLWHGPVSSNVNPSFYPLNRRPPQQ